MVYNTGIDRSNRGILGNIIPSEGVIVAIQLVQNTLQKVFAVDVGTDQLVADLRNNSRVVSLEQTDIRELKPLSQVDLIVIDEAHKLRNVYKDTGVMAPAIKEVFSGQKKLLLTATPFQNKLQELFGLMSLIDEDIFPDFAVFKEKYIKEYVENIFKKK